MAYEEKTGWCEVCMDRRVLRRKGINHVLHLLLTIFTVGCWVFVWLLTPLLRQPWLCAQCGSRNVFPGEQHIRSAQEFYRKQREQRG